MGEYSFETIPRRAGQATESSLNASGGYERVPFKIIPILSTPCDLYALSVLMVQTLLVTDQETIMEPFDELLSLAQAVKELSAPVGGDLCRRIQTILEQDASKDAPRWIARIGPHRLVKEQLDPKGILKLVPLSLWSEILALILQLQPGLMAESFCRDYADAPSDDLASVFDQPIEQLERLLIHTRSLLLVDWSFNREINQIVRDMLDKSG